MTTLLDKAIAAARELSAEEQDTIGAIILEEIASELRWAKAFAASQDALEQLADEALAEVRAGRATPLEFPPRK